MATVVPLSSCPRFDSCGAPVCPLDPNHLRSAHLPGEPTCLYLREAVKPGGLARLGGSVPMEVAEKVLQALPSIMDRYGGIRRVLERAKTSPSKIDQGRAGAALRFIPKPAERDQAA